MGRGKAFPPVTRKANASDDDGFCHACQFGDSRAVSDLSGDSCGSCCKQPAARIYEVARYVRTIWNARSGVDRKAAKGRDGMVGNRLVRSSDIKSKTG